MTDFSNFIEDTELVDPPSMGVYTHEMEEKIKIPPPDWTDTSSFPVG